MRGFTLSHEGFLVPIPQSAQRLLGFLALAGGSAAAPVRRRQLVDGLVRVASQCVPVHGALAHRADGIPLLEVTSTQLGLREDVEVDVRDVESSAHDAVNGDWARVDFLALASVGALLPDWYEDWVIVERERLRQLQLRGL
jgi:hypothetical protein